MYVYYYHVHKLNTEFSSIGLLGLCGLTATELVFFEFEHGEETFGSTALSGFEYSPCCLQ